ncbi:MAG: NfeD family protein [Chitinophagaceae bacterium]
MAIPASLVFVVQTIMTFLGGHSGHSMDTDFGDHHDGTDSGFQLFSLRNLINFLLGFSWAGISFYSTIENKALLISFSLLIGVLFVYLFFLIIRQVQKLAEDNSFKIINTLNKTAEVYIPIPERKSGKGKVMVSVNGAFHELDAMTENERIPSNAMVKVVKIENNDLLIVELI